MMMNRLPPNAVMQLQLFQRMGSKYFLIPFQRAPSGGVVKLTANRFCCYEEHKK